MKFIESHPEFQSVAFRESEILISNQLFEELKKFILRYADTVRRLTVVCVDIAERLSIEPLRTSLDWTLRQAYFEDLFLKLYNQSFTDMMDFLGDFAELHFDADARNQLNALLSRHNFKFILTLDQQNGSVWITADSIKSFAKEKPSSDQNPYPNNVLVSLERSISLIRSALNGESLIEELKDTCKNFSDEIIAYTGKSSVEEAFKYFTNDAKTRSSEILKDGLSAYNYIKSIENTYSVSLNNDETVYWIEKLESLRRYLYSKFRN